MAKHFSIKIQPAWLSATMQGISAHDPPVWTMNIFPLYDRNDTMGRREAFFTCSFFYKHNFYNQNHCHTRKLTKHHFSAALKFPYSEVFYYIDEEISSF
jgi:hypothetical protein